MGGLNGPTVNGPTWQGRRVRTSLELVDSARGRGFDSQHTLTIQDAGLWLCAQAFAHARARLTATGSIGTYAPHCIVWGVVRWPRCLLGVFVWRVRPWPAESLHPESGASLAGSAGV